MLARTLLPQPDQYTIIDRQRASANGFLVDPTAVRNTVALQHLLPSYVWVPKTAKASWKSIARYRNMSPLKLGIDRNVQPGSTFPLYTLFRNGAPPSVTTGSTVVKTGSANGQTFSVGMTPVYVSTASSHPAATAASTTTSVTPTVTTTPVGCQLGRSNQYHDCLADRVQRIVRKRVDDQHRDHDREQRPGDPRCLASGRPGAERIIVDHHGHHGESHSGGNLDAVANHDDVHRSHDSANRDRRGNRGHCHDLGKLGSRNRDTLGGRGRGRGCAGSTGRRQ